jgi:AraC-like DNA-binding protein
VPRRRLGYTSTSVTQSVAEEVGWSSKHLIAMFKKQIGLPPKAVARILRFHGIVRRLNRECVTSWADAAAASGYSDQSHLIRDFRRFMGESLDSTSGGPGSMERRQRFGKLPPTTADMSLGGAWMNPRRRTSPTASVSTRPAIWRERAGTSRRGYDDPVA